MVEAAGSTVQVVKGGSGNPLLILHEEMGHPGWMSFHESLSQGYELTIPSHPGFGDSPYIDWIMNMRDLAGWYLTALDDMGIEQTNLMGFSFGGLAGRRDGNDGPQTVQQARARQPNGHKAAVGGDIRHVPGGSEGVSDRELPRPGRTLRSSRPSAPRSRRPSRSSTGRSPGSRRVVLTWRPYMHYAALPHLLRRLRNLPTQIVWGRENPIVPLSASQVYHESVPGSRAGDHRQLRTPPRDRASRRVRAPGDWLPERLTRRENPQGGIRPLLHRRVRITGSIDQRQHPVHEVPGQQPGHRHNRSPL